MAFKLVKCPHCGFKFKTDLQEWKRDGEISIVRGPGFSKPKTRQADTVDLMCPHCMKIFEYR